MGKALAAVGLPEGGASWIIANDSTATLARERVMASTYPTSRGSGAPPQRFFALVSWRRRVIALSAMGMSVGGASADQRSAGGSDEPKTVATNVINDPEKSPSQVLPNEPVNEKPRVGPGRIVEGGGVRFIFYPRGNDRGAHQFDSDENVEADRSNPSIKEGEEVFHHYSDVMLKGVAHFQEREYSEAFEKFRLATEMIRRDPTSRMYAAHALLAMGDHGAAISFIREALTLAPDILQIDWNLQALYGPSAGAQKDYVEHVSRLKRRMFATPPNADLKILLAYTYFFGGQAEEAVKLLARAKLRTKEDRLLLTLEPLCRKAALETGEPPGGGTRGPSP
jgi:hypothetical protein